MLAEKYPSDVVVPVLELLLEFEAAKNATALSRQRDAPRYDG
jgi:hypothetical protein